MKILKLEVEGLPNFKDKLSIDFLAQQRVAEDDTEQLYNVFSNIYTNQVISFIGINASGKTTILKAISFAINLLNNVSLNSIPSNVILDGLGKEQKAVYTMYFYHDEIVYKLRTHVAKKINFVDRNEKFIITDETLWSKGIQKVKTKKGLYDFKESDLNMQREQSEQFLPDDVSIIIALNKKMKTSLFLYDMSVLTDYNILNVPENVPEEILTFLDPSIEYLNIKQEDKKTDIKLKFYGKDEIRINNPMALNLYLSSGTIKGIWTFMGALFVLAMDGFLIVDELENHFNKEIVSTLIHFFMDKKVNKKGSILLFSTHYSELLDQFDRNDGIYIVRNKEGIGATNLSDILKRNDIKKSEVYDSDFLGETAPVYDAYVALKKFLMNLDDTNILEEF